MKKNHMCGIKLYGTTTVGPKWQVVIPKEIRDKLDINPGDSMAIIMKENRFIGLVRNQDIRELLDYINSIDN
jgi:AbrB family looped-hinge helix DNA binding protein